MSKKCTYASHTEFHYTPQSVQENRVVPSRWSKECAKTYSGQSSVYSTKALTTTCPTASIVSPTTELYWPATKLLRLWALCHGPTATSFHAQTLVKRLTPSKAASSICPEGPTTSARLLNGYYLKADRKVEYKCCGRPLLTMVDKKGWCP